MSKTLSHTNDYIDEIVVIVNIIDKLINAYRVRSVGRPRISPEQREKNYILRLEKQQNYQKNLRSTIEGKNKLSEIHKKHRIKNKKQNISAN